MPRYTTFGRTPGDRSSVSAVKIFGRSILVWGHASNDVGYTPTAVNAGEEYEMYNYSAGGGGNSPIISVDVDALRARIGQAPVMLKADWCMYSRAHTGVAGTLIYAVRMMTTPDLGDCENRYKDKSALIPWGNSGDDPYWPLPGVDVKGQAGSGASAFAPFASTAYLDEDSGTVANQFWDIRSELELALRRSKPLRFLLYITTGTGTCAMRGSEYGQGYWPYLRAWYLNPVEIFQATPSGDIDLDTMVDESEENHFYLGAIQRSEVGGSVMGFVVNFGTRTIPHAAFLDDHPEWTDSVQSAGTGTGELDHVVLAELPTETPSQKYTIKFSNATDYEIKAEAYGNNPTGLHPQFDADTDWEGTVNSDFVATTGGLSIPKEAWQKAGILVNDEFQVLVEGNTSDITWPSDSAEQVEVCGGSAGVADGKYRKLNGRRTRSRASATIDATTKKIPVRAIIPSLWVVGSHAYIADDTNINEGQVKSAYAAEIGALTFTGTGGDDCHLIGNYNGTWEDTLRIRVNSGDTTKFDWSPDGGSSWSATAVAMPVGSGNAVELTDGIFVYFDASSGHVAGDYWDSAIKPWTVELEGLTANSNVYASGARVSTALPIRSLAPAVWSLTTGAAGASETPANRIPLADPATAGYQDSDVIHIKHPSAPQVSEYATILNRGSTYVDVTGNLEYDYAEGAMVVVRGSGAAEVYLRGSANATTDFELKESRTNVRI
ncbi:MAG: hypothetical protein GY906_11655 [bacterium]|nr:hypothetical protein [bacterium]